jgi:hypothetical protein
VTGLAGDRRNLETWQGCQDFFCARAVVLSSGDVYRAYGLFTGLEKGPLEPTPLHEDAPLRQALYVRAATSSAVSQPPPWQKVSMHFR